jgi:glycine dehydrogenase subunit 1
MISELTEMEATNSSLYDGFTSLSEAVSLAAAVTKRNEIVLSQAVHPNARAVVHAAAKGRGLDVIEVLMNKDVTNFYVTNCVTTPDTAAIIIQYPNFFGSVEDLAIFKKIAEEKGALLIVMANPLALGILEAPGKLGADIVVGDTQPFGLPMSFGGPHCGYFSVNQEHIRKVPGRIVGETVDADGERAFVLTLQSREQHIRREKATSYMSSNQALNALASAVCMAALGKQGVQDMAQLNVDKAAYFAQDLQAKGFAILNQSPFFNEFVIDLPFPAEEANRARLEAGIIGGYSLAETYDKPNQLLVCATEKRTKEEIDRFIAVLEGMEHA